MGRAPKDEPLRRDSGAEDGQTDGWTGAQSAVRGADLEGSVGLVLALKKGKMELICWKCECFWLALRVVLGAPAKGG